MRMFFGKSKTPSDPPKSSGGGGGGGTQARTEQLKSAIDKNNTAVENLDKRQRFLEKKVTDMDNKAREAAKAKNKRGAMEALKRKKMLLSELETLTNAKMTLESQVMSMEAAQSQAGAVRALEESVRAQKLIQQELNIDKVDQVMEDMQEQQDYQNEIAQCFQQGSSVMDDDDLLEEFNMMQAEEQEKDLLKVEEDLLNVGATPSTVPPQAMRQPAQPSAPARVQETADGLTNDEAAELAALQARLAW